MLTRIVEMTRVAPLFAAGFLITAVAVTLVLSGAGWAGLISVRFAGPAAELFEFVASLIGGTAAAVTLGQGRSLKKK